MNIKPYILIGGASQRFGSDKAMFEFNGETLATRAIRVAENALIGSVATLVAAREDQFPSLDQRKTIADTRSGLGAVGAVNTALAHSSTEWTFVLACDLPCVSPDFIHLLASFLVGDDDAIVPVQPDGRWQPLCAFYRSAKCRDAFAVASRDDENVPSLRSVVEKLDYRIVTYAEYGSLPNAEFLLENINEPTDLERRPCVTNPFVAK